MRSLREEYQAFWDWMFEEHTSAALIMTFIQALITLADVIAFIVLLLSWTV